VKIGISNSHELKKNCHSIHSY